MLNVTQILLVADQGQVYIDIFQKWVIFYDRAWHQRCNIELAGLFWANVTQIKLILHQLVHFMRH
jgi:hypothetical protein